MHPAPFAYHRPDNIDQAIDLLATADTHVLAGGHSLIPALKDRARTPDALVDVADLSALRGIDRSDRRVSIGAQTTYADLLRDDRLEGVAPALRDAVAAIGDRQIRNRGTIGGNLVQADAGADLPPAAIAAEMTATIRDPDGDRTVPVADLYPDVGTSLSRTAPAASLGPAAILTAVHLPLQRGAVGAYTRDTHPATGFATVGAAVRWQMDQRAITNPRVVVSGIGRLPRRLRPAEAALNGASVQPDGSPPTPGSRARSAIDPETVRSDPNVAAPYRHTLVASVIDRAVARAAQRAPIGADDVDGGDGS